MTDNPMVDTAPVRAHVIELVGYGLPPRSIAQAAGVAHNTVAAILDGSKHSCHLGLAQDLLGVTAMPRPDQDSVLAVGAIRRIRGLMAMAWPLAGIAVRLGMAAPNLSHLCCRKLITYTHWAAIRDLAEQLGRQSGPSAPARAVAVQRGWVPLTAWPPARLDDPTAIPLPRPLWRHP